MNYEALLDEACAQGLVVKEKPLQYNNGRIKGNRIAIRRSIPTNIEKACVLAEELGHHYTAVGNILDQASVENRKLELRGRIIAYNKMIGLTGLIDAFKARCRNRYEVAEYLDVTEEFLEETLQYYRSKYGCSTTIDNYMILFEPLGVLELYK